MTDLEFLALLLALPDLAGAKANILAIAQAAGLDVTSFTLGEPTERWIEIAARAMDAWGTVPQQAVRGFFLSLSTDPGDVADDGTPDASADQTPRPGFLSALGSGWFGTTRGGATRATGSVTYTNTSGSTQTFKPFALTFECTTLQPNGGHATYRNAASASIYTNPDGSVTVANGGVLPLPIVADQIGSLGTAGAGTITVLVTQTYGSATVTNNNTVTGRDREPRAGYIARCKLAPDKLSPGGPTQAYRYAMNTAKDGTPLQMFDGSGDCPITSAYVSTDSPTGALTIYYGGPDGPVDAKAASTANANIEGLLIADTVTGAYYNADPMGVLPDGVSIGPGTNDPNILPANTPGGKPCEPTAINVTYSVKIKASAVPGGATAGTYTNGGSPPANVAALFTTIGTALSVFFVSTGIGGLDFAAGAGKVYKADIPPAIRAAVAGLYDPIVTVPAGDTAITVDASHGYVATAGTVLGTIVVT